MFSDLMQRGAELQSMDDKYGMAIIVCLVPLESMMGFSTDLRMRTSGTATFSMELAHYALISDAMTLKVKQKVLGFTPVTTTSQTENEEND